jgi:hypothetical protein
LGAAASVIILAMVDHDPDMFDYYLKSLKGLGIHTFRVGGETITGSIIRVASDYIEVNVASNVAGSGRELVRIPFRAVQYVK